MQVVADLKAVNPKASAPISKLNGTWQLIYTSEKSVHGLVKLLPVQGITQTIDITDQRVTNRIQLAASSALQASAPMQAVSNSRWGCIRGMGTLTVALAWRAPPFAVPCCASWG
jgi:hypothetical protein